MVYDAVHAVQEYVERHLSEPIAVREMAAQMGRHPSYLNTCFQAQTGCSIKTYIHQRKTDEAKRLLRETSRPISEVGSMLGYFDQSHFSRTFRRFVGKTPGQYRMR